MKKVLPILLIGLIVFTSLARGTQPTLPTANLTKSDYYIIKINKVSLNSRKKLVVQIEITNKDKSQLVFSLGNLILTVVNSRTGKKEEWNSRKIFAKDRSMQHQPGSGGITIPKQSQALADIVFDNHVGTYAQEITQGIIHTYRGSFQIPELPSPNVSSSNSSSNTQTSSTPVTIFKDQFMKVTLLGTPLSAQKKQQLKIRIQNRTNAVYEYYPASTLINVYNKKKKKNEEWRSNQLLTLNRQYQRQGNGPINIPAKKSVIAFINFTNNYGPDAKKINSGTIYYECNTKHGSQQMAVPTKKLR